jgi:beta-lactamase regulating signal transducer with metallopeptidase domain
MSLSSFLAELVQLLPFLVAFTIKATVILLLAAIVSALLWRSSAAVRHLVWTVAVAGILALPLLSAVLPAWELPIPSAPSSVMPAELPLPSSNDLAALTETASQAPASSSAIASGPLLVSVAVALFLAGLVIGLLWLAAGFWGVARLGSRSKRVSDTGWLRTAHEAAEQLGLRRPVLLLRSERTVMPATWGLLWPSVIIPGEADEWPEDRRSAVLSHELAHVKRFDCLTQALAQIACILLWWHPLMWYAARRLRVERERACDDLVLAAGARPSNYATHLLEIARKHRSMHMASPALLSIAKPSELESRLLCLLNENCARTVPTVRGMALAFVAGMIVLAPLSAMQPMTALAPVTAFDPAPVSEAVASAPAPARPIAAVANSHRQESEAGLSSPKAVAARDVPEAPLATQADDPMEDLLALRSVGVDSTYIEELRAAGYSGLTARQLASMKGIGVSPAHIADLNDAGFGRLTPEQIITMKSVGVSSAYVQELKRQGLEGLSIRQVTRLKAVGVTGDYVTQMKAVGLAPIAADTLVDLHSVGITPDQVRDLAAQGFGPLAAKELVRRQRGE